MTVEEAAEVYLSAVCPVNRSTDDLNAAFSEDGAVGVERVRELARTHREALITAADLMDSPPAPWPPDTSGLVDDMVDQMLANLGPVDALADAATVTAARQAWEDLAASFRSDATTRISKIRLRLGLLGEGDPCASQAPSSVSPSPVESSPSPSTEDEQGGPGAAVGRQSQSQRRYALDNVVGSPVYVTWSRYQSHPDGSYTLSVDPWSPDLKGDAPPGCRPYLFYEPEGLYCLLNVTKRVRKVTLLPNADVFFGDSQTTLETVIKILKENDIDVVVTLILDASGYATDLVVYEQT